MKGHILIADDESSIRESLELYLNEEGFKCDTVADGQEAIDALEEKDYDLLLVDIRMPKKDGIEVLEYARLHAPRTLSLIITAYASIDTAIQALRKGAFDYLIKPLDFDELLVRIEHLLSYKAIALENKYLREQMAQQFNFNFIIGDSEPMQQVYDMIKRVSQSNTSVLITGDSGTGKELIARAIHDSSDRAEKPFFAVNCGAIPVELFASELFGHKKGAFTGADQDKEGLFLAANDGTLFLDEIAEIPLNVQVQLLRALQQKEIKPVGSNQNKSFNTRIITATNKNLAEEVEKGNFRDDLYYRLNIVEINVPRLKDRKEDIPILAQHFLNKYNRELNRSIKGIDNEAMRSLMSQEWKGNVRELENVIERAVLLSEDEIITKKDLPPQMSSEGSQTAQISDDSLNEALDNFEKQHIVQVLHKTNYNRTEAARLLSIDPSTLYRKMEKLNISVPQQD